MHVAIIMLDIDLKIHLTCHINCVDDITGNAPVALIEQDVEASVEMPCKLQGGHARRKSKTKHQVYSFPKVNRTQVAHGGNATQIAWVEF